MTKLQSGRATTCNVFFQSGSVQGALLWGLRAVPGPRRSGSE